jgi:hypothetical protein
MERLKTASAIALTNTVGVVLRTDVAPPRTSPAISAFKP